MGKKWNSILIGMLISAFLVGCSTTVMFTSNRPQQVHVNGELVGETPCSRSLSDAIWEDYHVTYTDVETGKKTYFDARKDVKVGALIGGIFLWPILLWVYGPDSVQDHYVDVGDAVPPVDVPRGNFGDDMKQLGNDVGDSLDSAGNAVKDEYNDLKGNSSAQDEASKKEYEEFLEYKKAKEAEEAKAKELENQKEYEEFLEYKKAKEAKKKK